MQDYSRPLGDALKRARGESGYTQRHAQPRRHKYIKQARSSGYGGAGSVLYIWLVAQYHFQLYNINSCFLSAFGTEQRKLYEDGICIYLCPGFSPACRARHPTGKLICFHHRFSCYIECRSALNVWLLIYFLESISFRHNVSCPNIYCYS